MTFKRTPTSWDDFKKKAYRELLPQDVFTMFSRFQARYRAARSMRLTLEDYSVSTSRGYESILRCGMAYSVLESLGNAIKEFDKEGAPEGKQGGHQKIKVESKELGGFFRAEESEKLREVLQTHLHKDGLKSRLLELEKSGDDVTPLAEGIRHLAFHGVFTPGTIDYQNDKEVNSVAKLMDRLPDAILDAANAHFTSWCELR